MIKILAREHRHCPIVSCDICGDMISHYNEGAAVFNSTLKEHERANVLHAHKGECMDLAEERIGPDAGWVELAQHLVQLCQNVEIHPADFVDLTNLYKNGL